MDKGRQVFALEIVRREPLEPVSSQGDQPQIRQLVNNFEVLVPAIELVLVQIKVHGARD